MLKAVAGWIPALIFVPVTGAAIGMGSWKGALLYFLVAAVGTPIKWQNSVMARIHGGAMERIALCFMLTAVATVVSGLETSGEDGTSFQKVTRRAASLYSAFAGKLAGNAEGDGTGKGAKSPEAVRRIVARRYRAAVETARGCDRAHRFAAGAIHRISRGDVSYNVPSAAAAASSACERSWMALSGPELLDAVGDKGKDGGAADQLRACGESYLGRWQVNDDLVYALKNGLPGREIAKIESMNSSADAQMSTCATLLHRNAKWLKRSIGASRQG